MAERVQYRVKLAFKRGIYRVDDGFEATIYRRGRPVGSGKGVTAQRAFSEAQGRAGFRGAYVIPLRSKTGWGVNELFSGRPVFFRFASTEISRHAERDRDRRRDGARKPSRAQQRQISDKIRVLRHEGYPPKQAIAIAYSMAGVGKRRRK